MRAWFEDLAPRERLLLFVAGGLTLIVGVWVFLVMPSISANAEARERYEANARALDVVAAGLAQIDPAQAVGGNDPAEEQDADYLRWRVVETAQFLGLQPSQLRSETDGSVSAVFRDTDPRLVFAYLQLLSTRESIIPRTANISRSDNGRVIATFEFQGSGS